MSPTHHGSLHPRARPGSRWPLPFWQGLLVLAGLTRRSDLSAIQQCIMGGSFVMGIAPLRISGPLFVQGISATWLWDRPRGDEAFSESLLTYGVISGQKAQ